MKKIIIAVLILCVMLSLIGCNKTIIDTKYTFDYALVSFPDGNTGRIEIESWKDYDGEQIQIKSTDGTTYLFHADNVVLVAED